MMALYKHITYAFSRSGLRAFKWLAYGLSLLLTLAYGQASAQNYYVNASATGANNGTSWTNAFTSLQSALSVATSGQVIWVAAGTYKPTTQIDINSNGLTARDATFQIPSGVQIYGGFAGGETLLSQRNFTTNVTILSGDLNGDDNISVTTSPLVISVTNNTENVFHVIYTLNVSNSTILDGFTIQRGFCDDTVIAGGAAWYNRSTSSVSDPIIRNVIFKQNTATQYGGAFYSSGSTSPNSANPTFDSCTFEHNQITSTNFHGGAVYNFAAVGLASATFTKCTFNQNRSAGNGGAVSNWNGWTADVANNNFTNCVFSGNRAISGGAVHHWSNTNTTYTNCLFYGNQATNGTDVASVGADGRSPVTNIINCTLYGSSGNAIQVDLVSQSATTNIRNSIIAGTYTNTWSSNFASNTINYSYCLTSLSAFSTAPTTNNQGNNIANTNPLFTNPAGNDFTLQSSSPAFNVGDNSFNATSFDLAGNTRIQNTTIDLGAYEYTVVPLQYRTAGNVTFAAATNWESSPDGTTWSTAASAPDGTANTLAITIRNGHTATVTASITRDQIVVEVGGTLVVNGGVQFTIADGTGDDLVVNGTLDVQGTNGVVDCLGQFVLAASAKLITANENGFTGGAVIDTGGLGTFTWTDGADYTLNGTVPQTANLPATTTSIRNIEINNTTGVAEGQALAFALSGTLTLTAGSFDISGAGVSIDFSGATPITPTGGNIITDASTTLTFSGTSAPLTLPNNLFSTSPATIAALVVSRTQDLNLGNQSLNVNNIVSISNTGKLNLNGNNIVLLAGATLTENLNPVVNGVVYDATATSYTTPGGYIEVPTANIPAFADGVYTPVAGIGLEIEGAATAITSVRRYHYPPTTGGGTGFSKGIKRVFGITGTAANGVTDIKINYASSELNGISDATPANMYISRWSSATGWQSFQHNGTNVIFTAGSIEMKDITTGFSSWTMSGSPAPLPISLVRFTGERVTGSQVNELTEEVKLEWTTAQEINNKGFEIEMSENGLTYENVAFVEGVGSSNTTKHYTLNIINPNDAYYRLKQLDFDGKLAYSPVVFVEGVNLTKVYPNPNNGAFTISVGKEVFDLPARLLNAQGKEVWKGMQTEVRTTDLPTGVYFLHTTVAGKAKITKVVVN